MPRKPRHLSAEERQLWERVAQTTRPNTARNVSKVPEEPPSRSATKPGEAPRDRRIDAFRLGEKSKTALPPTPVAPPPVKMDTKTFRKMKRGKVKPEARIDLHGMTQAAAHMALTHFILSAHSEGKRLVLVITGKGKVKPDDGPIPERVGVLRHQVPHWLDLPPLRQRVLQVAQAHVAHGGGGAFYVYLSRNR